MRQSPGHSHRSGARSRGTARSPGFLSDRPPHPPGAAGPVSRLRGQLGFASRAGPATLVADERRPGHPRPGAIAPRPSSRRGPTTARSRRVLKQLGHAAAARVRRRGPRPHHRPRPGGRRPGVPAPGRRLRRVVRLVLGRRHPRLAARSSSRWPSCSATPSGVPIVKVGRIAGQFAKPRSSDTERIGDVELPSFRGHIVNDIAPTAAARVPNPERLLQAYHQSASTLNLLRAFVKGGFADLSPGAPVEPGVRRRPAARASATSAWPTRSTGRCASCGPAASTRRPSPTSTRSTSSPATRRSSSATRRPSPARTPSPATGTTARPTCSGSASAPASSTAPTSSSSAASATPIGCKVGPTATADEVLALCEALNPERVPGRLTLISRMGADAIEDGLRPLLAAVRDAGHPVVWVCDPMHGNTFTSEGGRKTRHLDAVLSEIAGFFAAHPRATPGGSPAAVPGRPEPVAGGRSVAPALRSAGAAGARPVGGGGIGGTDPVGQRGLSSRAQRGTWSRNGSSHFPARSLGRVAASG